MQICGWYLEQLVGLGLSLVYKLVDDDDADSGVIAESMSVGCQPILDSSLVLTRAVPAESTREMDCELGSGVHA